MMSRRGHHIIHYGHESSQVECAEHVTVVTQALFDKVYGEYDWKSQQFKWDRNDEVHRAYTANCIAEIHKRKQKGDFVLCFFDQEAVGKAFFAELIVVHPGIGSHRPIWAPYNVFESHAVMNNTIGFEDPRWVDCVIPNYFDPEDFEYQQEKKDYLLILGRLIRRKGMPIAEDIAIRTGHTLIVAGQGTYESATGKKTAPPPCVKLVGYADAEVRKLLMKNAKALLQPTYYSEPFGGTVIEAGFCGTPVITTNWGAFAETVKHGKTGYRCQSMEQFEWAVNNIGKIKPQVCRDWAYNNYSMARVALKYEEYFQMLLNIKLAKGFYEPNPNRQELNWLEEVWPRDSSAKQVTQQVTHQAEKQTQKEAETKEDIRSGDLCNEDIVTEAVKRLRAKEAIKVVPRGPCEPNVLFKEMCNLEVDNMD